MNNIENYQVRKALLADFQVIWGIILFAKEVRKQQGSTQWQDGYPNEETIKTDIKKEYGYVIENQGEILGYFTIIFDREPAYQKIEGSWLSENDYTTIHRMAVSAKAKNKGIGKLILKIAEKISIENQRYSIRIDTNFDNIPMLKILEKQGYTYCGEVYYRGSARKAFEKILI